MDFRDGRTVVRAETSEGAIKALQKMHGQKGAPYRVLDPTKAPWATWPETMASLGFTWFDTYRGKQMGIWSIPMDGTYDPPLSVTKNFPARGWKVGMIWPLGWQMVLPPERGGANLRYHEDRGRFDAIIEELFQGELRKQDLYIDDH